MGRLTRNPEVKHIIPNHPEDDERVVARYTLAVDRGFKRQDEPEAGADFISCVCFQKNAIFAEKSLMLCVITDGLTQIARIPKFALPAAYLRVL